MRQALMRCRLKNKVFIYRLEVLKYRNVFIVENIDYFVAFCWLIVFDFWWIAAYVLTVSAVERVCCPFPHLDFSLQTRKGKGP
jgi:hypothetical protein